MLIPIENVGRVGVLKDVPAYKLPPEAWNEAQNVRFVDGVVRKMSGQATTLGTPSVAPHWLLPWKTSANERVIYGGTANLYYAQASSHTNITRYTTTPGDNDYTAGSRPLWTGGILHGVPIANNDNGLDPPQQWDGALLRMKDLTNWPASTYAKVIRPFKNILIALHVTESGTEYPYVIRWSHPADPGSVPSSWDYTDATKIAGRKSIAQSGGFLVDSVPLASRNILYKQDAIWTMSLAGSQFIFSFDNASDTIGALNTNCIVELLRQHFVVGQDDIVLFDGLRPTSILTKRMRTWFYNLLDATHWDKTVVALNKPAKEVWVCFVESGATSEYLNKALVWNWEENSFTVKDLPDIAYAHYGQVGAATTDSFDSVTGTFDAATRLFDSAGSVPSSIQMLMARAYSTSQLLEADSGFTDRGTAYNSYVERTGLAIVGRDRQGNPQVDPASVKFIRAVFPKISAPNGTVLRISVGVHDELEGSVTWDGPHNFTVGTDVKIDTALSGKYLAFKLEDNSAAVSWDFSGYTLDMDIISRF